MPSTVEVYFHECRGHRCGRWSKYPHHKEDQKALEKSITEDSIVHRHVRDEDNTWTTKSFTVHDSFMRAHLLSALEDYQDLDLELQKWMFKPPYEPLVHRWSSIVDIPESEEDPEKVKALSHLADFLRPILADPLEGASKTAETGMVTFDHIWHIFPPDELVLTTFYGVETACRITA